MRAVYLATAIALATAVPAFAAGAICQDYIHARGEDRSLMDGFVYGFVSARMEGRPSAEIDAATIKVKQLTAAYCLQKPRDSIQGAVGTFADTIARFKH